VQTTTSAPEVASAATPAAEVPASAGATFNEPPHVAVSREAIEEATRLFSFDGSQLAEDKPPVQASVQPQLQPQQQQQPPQQQEEEDVPLWTCFQCSLALAPGELQHYEWLHPDNAEDPQLAWFDYWVDCCGRCGSRCEGMYAGEARHPCHSIQTCHSSLTRPQRS